MKRSLTIAALAASSIAICAPGSSWRTVSWNGSPLTARLWDYTEGSGVATNPRVLNTPNGFIHDVDYGSGGILYACASFNNNGIFTVNENTGAVNQIASIGTNAEGDMTYDAAGNRLLISQGPFDKNIYQVDLSNNNVSVFYSATGYDDIQGLAADNSGNVWAIHNRINSTGIAELLKWNGSGFTSYGSLGPGLGVNSGMDIDQNGDIYTLANNGVLYKVNATFGSPSLTQVDVVGQPFGTGFTGLAYATAVPEPATLAVVGLGLVGFIRRRRR